MDSISLDPGSPLPSLYSKLYAEAFLTSIMTRKYKSNMRRIPTVLPAADGKRGQAASIPAATSTFGFMASIPRSGDTPFVFPVSYHMGL